MNKLLTSIAALAFVFASGIAGAAETTGKIAAVNAESQMITLENGMQFTAGEGVSIENLKPGDEVKVTYEEEGEDRTATAISPAQSE